MRLRTLGDLALEAPSFHAPKPLALLAYLTLEGPQDRRFLADLFWPQGRDALKSLTVALAQLRKGAPGAVGADRQRAWSHVSIDVHEMSEAFEAHDVERGVALYGGPFLHGVHPHGLGEELEEWILGTREHLAERVSASLLELAEREAARGRTARAASAAERAYGVPGAPPLSPRNLKRTHALLTAGDRPLARTLRDEAGELDLDLPDVAPAPVDRAAATRPPATSLPFVGRREDLAVVRDLLARPDGRLATLLGPPGVGKTRLAREVAREEADSDAWDGVHWVGLDDVDGAEELAGHVAHALGLRPAGGGEPWAPLVRAFGDAPHLLLLDDAERLAAAGPVRLDALLGACPGTKILVTSRVRLGLTAERVVPLGGLPYPKHDDVDADAALAFAAVDLFVRRARRLRPGFALTDEGLAGVLAICRRTDGLPLALELSAGWTRVLSPAGIAAELDRSLERVRSRDRDVPARHQDLRAAFDGSWRLLSEDDRATVVGLATFHAPFGAEAAAAVAGAGPSRLASLVDASLLAWDGVRHYRLHPLVRSLARRKADGRAWSAVAARHAEYVLGDLAKRPEAHRLGVAPAARLPVDDVASAWRWAASNDRDDLRSAAADGVGWSLFVHGRFDLGLRLMEQDGSRRPPFPWRPLYRAMFLFGLHRSAEAAVVTERALADAPPGRSELQRAHLHRMLGVARHASDPPDPAGAEAAYREALEIYERLGDEEGAAMMVNNLASAAADVDDGLTLVAGAIERARATGQDHALGMALSTRAELLFRDARGLTEAARSAAEAANLHEASGFLPQLADTLLLHAEILLATDDPAGAQADLDRVSTLCRELDPGPAAERRAAGRALRTRAAAARSARP